VLGVTPRWLPYGSVDFDRHGGEEEIRAAVHGCVEQADVVLVPGSPLTHPDHAWLSALLATTLPSERVARYAEQPYTLRAGDAPFAAEQAGARDRLAKWRAIRAYRSQLPLLGMTRNLRRGPLRLALADERVAWPRE
jgi:LmbE family N-acetylglucosaminyl deacetylase